MRRNSVSKTRSAKSFRNNTRKTRAINIQNGPMRGGWRL